MRTFDQKSKPRAWVHFFIAVAASFGFAKADAATLLRVNAGGQALTTSRGAFAADQDFKGGALHTYPSTNPTRTIIGAQNQSLYLTVHFGPSFTFSTKVDNGTYELKLHFAECTYNGVGHRLMNVTAQGKPALTKFDIFKEAGGKDKVVVKTLPITVTNGQVDLSFVSQLENKNAVIAAIELSKVTTTPFTIVALPDTQIYSYKYPHIFSKQTQWIADNAKAKNIQAVLSLGDIVDAGDHANQWDNAEAAIKLLGKVPFIAAIGNHDYDFHYKKPMPRDAKKYNERFGPKFYEGTSFYKGNYPSGSNENYYNIFNINGRQYLVVVLEFYPRTAALDWANNVIRNHADLETWIITHSYMYSDDTRVAHCDNHEKSFYGLNADNNGEDMWNKLVRKHANISLVLSGHINDHGTGRRIDIGDKGNIVNQMLSDYQGYENGGNGYLRLLEFRTAENKISVTSYSPFLEKSMTDAKNQFSLVHRAPAGVPKIDKGAKAASSLLFSGKVRNASCGAVAGAKVSYEAGKAITDSKGKFSITVNTTPGYALRTPIKIEAAGYTALQGVSTVCSGDPSCGVDALLAKPK